MAVRFNKLIGVHFLFELVAVAVLLADRLAKRDSQLAS